MLKYYHWQHLLEFTAIYETNILNQSGPYQSWKSYHTNTPLYMFVLFGGIFYVLLNLLKQESFQSERNVTKQLELAVPYSGQVIIHFIMATNALKIVAIIMNRWFLGNSKMIKLYGLGYLYISEGKTVAKPKYIITFLCWLLNRRTTNVGKQANRI